MRDLYTRHASTLPAYARDAIASLFGRDALDSRVCDLMTLAEWQDVYDAAAPTHPDSCYVCAGDSPAYRADHEYVTPCDAIGHQYGTSSEDYACYGCGQQACDPAAIAPDWAERQERAYRAAEFFEQARAARDDIAETTLTLTPAAIEALSIILDVNDDDDIMIESGVPMEGLMLLREIAGRA